MPILTLKSDARLKHFLSQLQILTQDPTILNMVQGYSLQFHTQSTQTVKRVTTVSKENVSIFDFLNQFVINEHFQMENISCIKQILNQNDFMVKLVSSLQ